VPDRTRDDTEAEIAAIVARLRDEVGRGPDAANRPPPANLAARAQADRTWAVSAERPIERPPNRRGRMQTFLVAPVKRLLRKLMRWYVEPLAAQQRSFNLNVLNLVDELAERVEALERRRAGDAERDG
jgi:hypothetical protein